MRYDLIDSLVIGGSIGLIVLAINQLAAPDAAQWQLLALLAAGVVLFCVQLALALRRARSAPNTAQQRTPARGRRDRHNAFFRELTDDWTGLDEHIVDRNAQMPKLPDDIDAEPWATPASEEQPLPSQTLRK